MGLALRALLPHLHGVLLVCTRDHLVLLSMLIINGHIIFTSI